MKKYDKICDSDLICRYYDKELSSDEYAEVEGHIGSCPQCRERLEKYRIIANDIKSEVEISENQYRELQDRILESIDYKRSPFRIKWKEILGSKKFLIPAGAAICLFIAFVTFFNRSDPSGPTAIITTLTGNGSSVMILETPETRQTILWFNENGNGKGNT